MGKPVQQVKDLLERKWFVLALIAACRSALFLFSLFLVSRTIYSWDSFRFLTQAASMLNGGGFQRMGVAETMLPPGYPVFLMALLSASGSHVFIAAAQLVLSTASCYLVYFSLQQKSKLIAALAALGMAVCPMTGRLSQLLLSETLGVFLSCVVVWLLSRYARRQLAVSGFFLLGAAGSVLLLTSPAVLFLVYALLLSIVWRSRLSLKSAMVLAGAGVALLPWFTFCIKHDGRVYPTILKPADSLGSSGRTAWLMSWSLRCEDQFRNRTPDHAFGSPDNKRRIQEAFSASKKSGMTWDAWMRLIKSPEFGQLAAQGKISTLKGSGVDDVTVQALGALGAAHRDAHPVDHHLIKPAVRGLMLWLEPGRFSMGTADQLIQKMRDVMPPSRGDPGARNRCGAGGLARRLIAGAGSAFLLVLPGLYAITFALLAVFSMRRTDLISCSILIGVVLYTAISAYFVDVQPRRNVVFYPFLFYLATYLPARMANRPRGLEAIQTSQPKSEKHP
jgi:hypothetical protein